jgi:hypothetical protein
VIALDTARYRWASADAAYRAETSEVSSPPD